MSKGLLMHLCQCGCGNEVRLEKHKYIHGHNKAHLGKKHSEEAKETMSLAHKGKTLSEEHKHNISKSMEGREVCSSTKQKIGLANKGKLRTAEQKIHISERTKLEMEKIKNDFPDRFRHECFWKGKFHTENTKRLISFKIKDKWQDPEYIEKHQISQDIKPNKPESFLISLLAELYPNQWQYTGDFSYWINGKNPDFVNMEQKLIIEHFGDYWHRDDDPEQRKEIFAREGWDTLVIWEHELKNLDDIIYKIRSFVEI